jgi:hypothetical protein
MVQDASGYTEILSGQGIYYCNPFSSNDAGSALIKDEEEISRAEISVLTP